MDGEARLAHLGDRGQGAVRVVHPAEKAQRIGFEALHADADPVDPRRLPHARAVGVDARRVRLHGHLGAGRDRERAPDRCNQAREQLRLDQRRRAATDEDGVERQPAEALAELADLRAQRIHVLARPRGPGDAREIAVLAFPLAERNVQVERADVVESGVFMASGPSPAGRAPRHRPSCRRSTSRSAVHSFRLRRSSWQCGLVAVGACA